jgi:hypothetical protein
MTTNELKFTEEQIATMRTAIDENDLLIETYHATSGTWYFRQPNCVRITYKPSGFVVSSETSGPAHRNRALALDKLAVLFLTASHTPANATPPWPSDTEIAEGMESRLVPLHELLCEDEGCPQHGTPHVCVTVPDIRTRISRLLDKGLYGLHSEKIDAILEAVGPELRELEALRAKLQFDPDRKVRSNREWRLLAEQAEDDRQRLQTEVDKIYAAVGDHWFLDPPDGGCVYLHEGVKRIEVARDECERQYQTLLHVTATERDGYERRIQDLLEANNQYLERARTATVRSTQLESLGRVAFRIFELLNTQQGEGWDEAAAKAYRDLLNALVAARIESSQEVKT